MKRNPVDGFDFTQAMRMLCGDFVARLAPLRHIQLGRVAIGICQTRRDVTHGLYASLTPLRFEGGSRQSVVDGRRCTVRPLLNSAGREYLYLLNFYLPRFLNTPLEEKLSTVVHELWHISPAFDGDLRRHAGRCFAHGQSQREYDAQMDRLAQAWLAADPPAALYDFLTHTHAELVAEYGSIVGQHWPAPKLQRA